MDKSYLIQNTTFQLLLPKYSFPPKLPRSEKSLTSKLSKSAQRWREEGKTGHNGAGQHDKCSHVSNRCHPSPHLDTYPPIRRWGCRELATYPPLAHQLRRVLGASRIWRRKENECDEDDDWEYVEEGPAEIIWQGNEIIIRKKKVKVPKKDANPLSKKEDKAHCHFHLKTGACRFGQRCSIVHFYPDKSCTLLIKNMYNGPGLAWEQDEGLEEDLAVEKGHEEKKKNIALKASKHESDEESELDDEELAMLARRFRKFYMKTNERGKFRNYKNKKEMKEPITCYECKKPGHIRPECSLLNKLKKKAMVATDEETSDDEKQQEITNLALMAFGEKSCDELDE
ncbi:hypothetical protein CUMW_214080, partial [Citrus unshiu]